MDYREFCKLVHHINGVNQIVLVMGKNRGGPEEMWQGFLDSALDAWLGIYPDSPLEKIEGLV